MDSPIGIVILMEVTRKPQISSYWSKGEFVGMLTLQHYNHVYLLDFGPCVAIAVAFRGVDKWVLGGAEAPPNF